MNFEVVPLNPEYLDRLLAGASHITVVAPELHRTYFSPYSVSCCMLADGEPVFAGGIVNLQWNRGEAWMLPTPFFRQHVKTCLRSLKEWMPRMAQSSGFVRVQATCVKGVSARILGSLGFSYEGTMQRFGPNGEVCDMYARIFEVMP